MMIQRIQSIYLLVAAISMTLISFKVPVYNLNETLFMAQDDTKMFVLTIVRCYIFFIRFVYVQESQISNEINPINDFNSNDYWNSHIYAV